MTADVDDVEVGEVGRMNGRVEEVVRTELAVQKIQLPGWEGREFDTKPAPLAAVQTAVAVAAGKARTPDR